MITQPAFLVFISMSLLSEEIENASKIAQNEIQKFDLLKISRYFASSSSALNLLGTNCKDLAADQKAKMYQINELPQ